MAKQLPRGCYVSNNALEALKLPPVNVQQRHGTEVSFSERYSAVWDALQSSVPGFDGIYDLFDTYVVYAVYLNSTGFELYRCDYTYSAKVATLGTLAKVEVIESYQPVAATVSRAASNTTHKEEGADTMYRTVHASDPHKATVFRGDSPDSYRTALLREQLRSALYDAGKCQCSKTRTLSEEAYDITKTPDSYRDAIASQVHQHAAHAHA